MPHLPEQGNYYISHEDFCRDHGAVIQADPIAPNDNITFPITVDALTKQWIESIATPLQLMMEASKRPRYFVPFNGGYHYEFAGNSVAARWDTCACTSLF